MYGQSASGHPGQSLTEHMLAYSLEMKQKGKPKVQPGNYGGTHSWQLHLPYGISDEGVPGAETTQPRVYPKMSIGLGHLALYGAVAYIGYQAVAGSSYNYY